MRVHDNQLIAILLVVELASLGSACSVSHSSVVRQKEVKKIVSWLATTRAVGQAWKDRSVPSAYAARTLQTAQENLKQEIENIQSLAIPEPAKVNLSLKLQQMETSMDQAAHAVRNNDTSALEQTLAQLTTAQQALSASTK